MHGCSPISPPQRAAAGTIFENRRILRQTFIKEFDCAVNKPGDWRPAVINTFAGPEALKPSLLSQHTVAPEHPVVVKRKLSQNRMNLLPVGVRCFEPTLHFRLLVES